MMPFINDMLNSIAAEQKQKALDHDQDANLIPTDIQAKKRKVQTRFTFDPDEVMKRLRGRIHGQERALQAVGNMLKIVRADISDPDKPLYIGLFLGPSGVGKTEIVKVLSEIIHGNRNQFCRVDMNTLSQDHYAAALTGAPPGYVGSKEGSTILDKEKIEGTFSKPGIILFDEIEKASRQVIQTLLNVFDNGKMVVSSGDKVIDFRNTIIFMTSNLGASAMYKLANDKLSFLYTRIFHYLNPKNWGRDDETLLNKMIAKKLENTFAPEFINRIDDIITFNWLTQNTLNAIADTFLEQINRRLRKYNCELQLDLSAREFINHAGFNKRFGGRALKRAMRQYIEVPLSELLIERSMDEQFVIFTAKKKNDGSGITIA